jgi:hypothetical protein
VRACVCLCVCVLHSTSSASSPFDRICAGQLQHRLRRLRIIEQMTALNRSSPPFPVDAKDCPARDCGRQSRGTVVANGKGLPCVYFCRTYWIAVRGRGRRIVEDMCCVARGGLGTALRNVVVSLRRVSRQGLCSFSVTMVLIIIGLMQEHSC